MQHASRSVFYFHLQPAGVDLQQGRLLLVKHHHVVPAPVSHRHRDVHPPAEAPEQEIQGPVFPFPEIDAKRIGAHRLEERRQLAELVKAVVLELFGSLAPLETAGALEELEGVGGDGRFVFGWKRLLSIAGQGQEAEQEKQEDFHSSSIRFQNES